MIGFSGCVVLANHAEVALGLLLLAGVEQWCMAHYGVYLNKSIRLSFHGLLYIAVSTRFDVLFPVCVSSDGLCVDCVGLRPFLLSDCALIIKHLGHRVVWSTCTRPSNNHGEWNRPRLRQTINAGDLSIDRKIRFVMLSQRSSIPTSKAQTQSPNLKT